MFVCVVLVAFVRQYREFVERSGPEAPLTRRDFAKEGYMRIDKKVNDIKKQGRKRERQTDNLRERGKTQRNKLRQGTERKKEDKRMDAEENRKREREPEPQRIFQQEQVTYPGTK